MRARLRPCALPRHPGFWCARVHSPTGWAGSVARWRVASRAAIEARLLEVITSAGRRSTSSVALERATNLFCRRNRNGWRSGGAESWQLEAWGRFEALGNCGSVGFADRCDGQDGESWEEQGAGWAGRAQTAALAGES